MIKEVSEYENYATDIFIDIHDSVAGVGGV
jgi:hypothetical protein